MKINTDLFHQSASPSMEPISYWLKYSPIFATKETFLLFEMKTFNLKIATSFSSETLCGNSHTVGLSAQFQQHGVWSMYFTGELTAGFDSLPLF